MKTLIDKPLADMHSDGVYFDEKTKEELRKKEKKKYVKIVVYLP